MERDEQTIFCRASEYCWNEFHSRALIFIVKCNISRTGIVHCSKKVQSSKSREHSIRLKVVLQLGTKRLSPLIRILE